MDYYVPNPTAQKNTVDETVSTEKAWRLELSSEHGSPSRDFDTSGPAGGAVGARADGRAPEHEVRWRVGYKLGVASALIL